MKFNAFLLSAFVVSFVAGASSNSYAAAEAPILKLRINGDPTTLDWNKQLDLHSERVTYQIMEGLISVDDKVKVHPALAQSWTVSKDMKTYTFKLRPGVKWSDGVELEAQHFVDSVERVLSPKTAAPGGPLLYDIDGAQAFNKGESQDAKTVGISAPSKSTLVVRLRRPLASPPGVFDHPLAFPIRKDLIEKFQDQWTKTENLVTLGAYQLVSWQPGDRVRLKAYANYYGKKPKYEQAEFLIVPDDTAGLRLFESGQVDMMVGIPVMDLARLEKSKSYRAFEQTVAVYAGFNFNVAPFNDPRVRQAFAHATDTAELARILGGGKTPSTGWIHSRLRKTKWKAGLEFNVTKAKKLLAEAGFPDGKGFPPFTFANNLSDENRIMTERLQSMWKKNLGVEATIELETWKTYLSKVRSGNPPAVFRLGLGATSFEPFEFANSFSSTSALNYAKWSNSEYDALIKKASLRNPQEFAAAEQDYAKAEKILLEKEAVILPLFESSLPVLKNDKFANLRINGRSKYLLKDL